MQVFNGLIAGADPGFPVGGAPTLGGEGAPTYEFVRMLSKTA